MQSVFSRGFCREIQKVPEKWFSNPDTETICNSSRIWFDQIQLNHDDLSPFSGKLVEMVEEVTYFVHEDFAEETFKSCKVLHTYCLLTA